MSKNIKYDEWKVTYIQNGKEKGTSCFSKKTMVKEYLDILEKPFTENISSLKIWKNDTEYTGTLNKFLSK